MLHIGICHQNVRVGDAIGHDIHGMYDLLTAMGFHVTILGDYFDEITQTTKNIQADAARIDTNPFDLLIYHHSIYWEQGEALLHRCRGARVLRYHNVTPPAFFRPYSQVYTDLCERGRAQTQYFADIFGDALWLATSAFNRQELISYGTRPASTVVVPPFNGIANYLRPAVSLPAGPVTVLFISRFVPHKGHRDLVRIIHAYVRYVAADIVLYLVGGEDDQLQGYYQEIQELIATLGLTEQVRCLSHVPAETLEQLLHSTHVFLCTSQHEGFCVPVIEAQAAGLPVITVNTTALSETAGPDQLVGELPRGEQDYLFYALLIREACSNHALRQTLIEQGYHNVLSRFTADRIANSLITSLLPVLQRLMP